MRNIFIAITLVFLNFYAVKSQVSCINWLNTPSYASTAAIGDLDITGNQLTVEVSYNSKALSSNGSWGHLVSKHTNTTNVNYAISPNGAEITTTGSGYIVALQTCPIQLNKTYHTAMVYDGTFLKFYRNGFLMSQTPCTGNLINNNLLATIGQVAGPTAPGEQFNGYINEVRIWNVARTQAQVQTYMNASLPNPTTQAGLQGYYTFDNLVNKQGNAAYNGTLGGGATINQTNPNCNYTADSCTVNIPVSNIINDYTPVLGLGLNPCSNKLIVEDGAKFNAGDTVLLIQMKGAVIDSNNTAAFGNITDYKSAGNYEFNYVKSRSGNEIELKNVIVRSYEIPGGKVQLVRVPYYDNATVTSTLTCLPWDGSKGGVLVFNVKDTLILNADIDVSARGFRGGNDPFTNPVSLYCYENQYYYPPNPDLASEKGEGIAGISSAKSYGKGALANGGGGGNSHNSGGGGGSNGSAGGLGGYQYEFTPCNATVPFNNRGLNGNALAYSTAANKIFTGGGGGAGQSNNPEGFQSKGGNGAGIVIITAGKVKANSRKIIANGNPGVSCGLTTSGCHEGMGGGGAAGTILLSVNTYLDNINVEAKGGKGADMTAAGFSRVAPGGGGSGGVVWFTNSSLPTNVAVTNTGGANGICTAYSNDPWGAGPGLAGINLFNLVIPVTNPPFKPNIDSVRIKDSSTACKTFDFKGLGFTNTVAITNWQWFFGDGGTANTQNTSHTYTNANTTYTVKLVVTDVNGCKDSVLKTLTTGISAADAGPDTSFCSNTAVSVLLQASGGSGYTWTPAAFLSNTTIPNPLATVSTTTKFYVTVINAAGCTGVDSVTVFIKALPDVKTNNDTSICQAATLLMNATGAASYSWSPGTYLNDSTISNPVITGTQNQQLVVTGTAANGCKSKDTINIAVNPLPLVKTIADTVICNALPITLTTTGAQTYQWSPAVFLSNPNIASPVFNGNGNNVYQVTGTDANGCKANDTVTVTLVSLAGLQPPPDKVMCRFQTVTLDGNNGPGYQYAWSPAAGLSNPGIQNPLCNVTATTPYLVTITEPQCNLQRNFNIIVTVNQLPGVNAAKENDIDCSTPFTNLAATGAAQYAWSPVTGLNNAFIANPVAAPGSNTLYIVKGTDANGCFNFDSVEVKVSGNGKDFTEIPNSFTPNGDGKNDCFGPGKFWRNIVSIEFMVYSRWGERVFYSTNTGGCWDGNYKGAPAEAGGYVYYLKAATLCGLVEKKGNVLLMR